MAKPYKDKVWCDVMPTDVRRILHRRPWRGLPEGRRMGLETPIRFRNMQLIKYELEL